MIDYVCSIFALPFTREEDIKIHNQPFLTGTSNGVKLKCLIDTGTSVSCMSKFSFEAIPNNDSLESVPIPPGFWLSSATGHNFSLVGYYLFEFHVLGRVFTRPFFVISGLSILGIVVFLSYSTRVHLHNMTARDILYVHMHFCSSDYKCSLHEIYSSVC